MKKNITVDEASEALDKAFEILDENGLANDCYMGQTLTDAATSLFGANTMASLTSQALKRLLQKTCSKKDLE